MSSYPVLSTRVIGQAEKTLGAILDRQLAGTGLTEPQWVILTLAVTGGGAAHRDRFTSMVADALKISEAEAKARVSAFIESLGLRPMDTGQLPMARTLEHLALLSLGLVAHSVKNTNFSLGVSFLGSPRP